MDKKFFFTVAFILVLAGVGYALYLIFEPFLTSLLWAGVIVVVFYPWYQRLLERLSGKADSAALLMCLGLTLLILLPATFLLIILLQDVADGAAHLTRSLSHWNVKEILQLPLVATVMEWVSRYIDLSTINLESTLIDTAKRLSQFLLDSSSSFFKAFSGFFILMGLVELNMFFLFRDGRTFLDFLQAMLPIPAQQKQMLLGRMREVIQASIYGTLMTACVQGVLGGIAFALLGLPSAILWGVVMMLMSFLPLFGPFVVWGPAAGYLAWTGHPIKALIMVIWGVVVIGMSDNVLRPVLMRTVSSENSQLNTLVLFLSVLGGMQVFGFLGIVLGPLTVVIALTLIELGQMAFQYSAMEVPLAEGMPANSQDGGLHPLSESKETSCVLDSTDPQPIIDTIRVAETGEHAT